MDLEVGSRVAFVGLTSERGRRLNGVEGVIDGWDAPSARWIVRLHGDNLSGVKSRPENLVILRAHRSTVEPAMASEARRLLSATHANAASTGGTCGFGGEDISLPADLMLLHVLPHLTRHTVHEAAVGLRITAGELEAVSEVCQEWRGACLALRALTPACARDVQVKLQLEDATREAAGADGEHRIWPRGDRSAPPISMFCHNVLGGRPTEFLSLRDASDNLSYFPAGGAARGSVVVSSFRKLRICPWTLRVKTDDFTFATSGGRLVQSYWNGARRLDVSEVPFATARDAAFHATGGRGTPSPNRGQARIDLRGTGLAVRTDQFESMGCAAFGVVAVPMDGGADLGQFVQPRVVLYGGGFAGRMTPIGDRTLDERAKGGDYDDEGRNGGWVLPLVRADVSAPRPAGQVQGSESHPGNMFECPIATMAHAGRSSGADMLSARMLVVHAEERD